LNLRILFSLKSPHWHPSHPVPAGRAGADHRMIQVTGNLNLNNRQRDCLREIQMLLLYPDVIMYIQVAKLAVIGN
jgi:hypothetical protein